MTRRLASEKAVAAAPAAASLSAYLVAALPPLFFSGNFLIARMMRDDIPPIQMSFWRWSLALVLLLPFASAPLRRDWPGIRSNLPFLAMLGAIGVTAFNCFVYSALHFTTVINAALVNALLPVMTFLCAYLILGQTVSPRRALGMLISFVGAAFVITHGDLNNMTLLSIGRGEILVFTGMSFWALYTVLVRWRPLHLSPVSFLGVTCAFGVLFHLPAVAWEIGDKGGFSPMIWTLTALCYLAIFPSLLAYVVWNRSAVVLGPATTGIFMQLLPIFSVVLAVAFLGETLAWYHAAGLIVILAGIGLVTSAHGQ